MSASVPVKVMVASAVPSPVVKVSAPSVPSERQRAVGRRQRHLVDAARRQRRVDVGDRQAGDGDRRVLAAVAVAGAFEVTGSLTGVTVTSTTSLSLVAAPVPVAMTPPTSSVTEMVTVAAPLKFEGRGEARRRQRRVDVGQRAGEGHGGVGGAVAAGRERQAGERRQRQRAVGGAERHRIDAAGRQRRIDVGNRQAGDRRSPCPRRPSPSPARSR